MTKMDDVVQIVNQNADRARWAAEISAQSEPEVPAREKKPRRNESKFRAIHTAVLACAMFAGAGAAFVGIGLTAGDLLSVGVGLLVVCLFISTGARLDGLSRSV